LGHATRCVPIIRTLLNNGNTVILGSTALTEKIFKVEFPSLERVSLPGYDISYSSILPLWLKLGAQLPKVLKVISKEHAQMAAVVQEKNIDIIISDNRYGLHSSKTKNYIICHQVNLKTPFFERWSNSTHVDMLKKFDEVWVPDHEEKEKKLSGELSENVFGLECRYIGPLSRLEKKDLPNTLDHLFLLSGPEPGQSDLLKKIVSRLENYKKKAVIVSSSDACDEMDLNSNIDLIKLPSREQLNDLIASAKTVVCRSGYSTLMDMHLLGKSELTLIPTPGQTEQEYLALYWSRVYNCIYLPEDQLGAHTF
jgi:hypothetical protein